MAKLFDRIGQATATTGTGSVTLGAVITDATNGDLATFTDMGGVAGDVVNYLIVDGSNWEIGTGTLGGTGPGFTLTRTVAKSKISGTVGTTALTLSGSAKVYSAALTTHVLPTSVNSNLFGFEATNIGPYFHFATASAGIFGFGGNLLFNSVNGGVGLTLGLNMPLAFSANGNVTDYASLNGPDTHLNRDGAARTLALRTGNSTGHTFRVYGSTDSNNDLQVNYSRLSIAHLGGTSGAVIKTEAGGTGTAGPLTLSNGTTTDIILGTDHAVVTVGGGTRQFCVDNQARIKMQGGARIGWGETFGTLNAGYSLDTALARNAAGVVEINNGTAGTYRDLKARTYNLGGAAYLGTDGNHAAISSNGYDFRFHSSLGGKVGFTINNFNVQLTNDTGAAGSLALSSEDTPSAFSVYGGQTSNFTNYSRIKISHAGGTSGATIATEAGGTGTAGPLTLNGAQISTSSDIRTPSGGQWIMTQNGAAMSGNRSALFYDAGSGAALLLTQGVGIGASYSDAAGADVYLMRNAAGVFEINSGTAGTYRDLIARNITVTGNGGGSTLGTAQATTSGTAKDYTALAANTKRVQVIFDQVSVSTSLFVRLGTSGGFISTGYVANARAIDSAGAVTTSTSSVGFLSPVTTSVTGILTLDHVGGNVWVASGNLTDDSTNIVGVITGRVSLGAALTQVRVGASAAFTGGQVNVITE